MRRRRLLIALGILLALVLAAGNFVFAFMRQDEPAVYADVVEHYKYGSIGTEAERGVPYYIWAVLPRVFGDLLPPGPGQGYERFGFIIEPGAERPIGLSYREKPIGLIGVNCAACHTGTLREAADGPRRVILGMPANRLNLQEYVNFLRAIGRDPRFTSDTLMAAIEERFPRISRAERLFYRYVVIPTTKDGLRDIDVDFRWTDRRPPSGAGRGDAFNPVKVYFDILPESDRTVGTADFPSVWNQRARRGLFQHWDGNNGKLEERSIAAAIFSGATEDSVDVDSIDRVVQWLLTLPPRGYPRSRIDAGLAARGEPLFDDNCGSCHSLDGARIGQIIPLAQIGTDPDRLSSVTPELVERLNTLGGEGRSWSITSYRTTNGYSNQPLDGIWLRAPFLHNGSVPSLRALLFPEERPAVFWTGYDVYDWEGVGFVASGPAARSEGFRYDTSLRGNANTGHLYGSDLSAAEREAIIEYLKTL